MSYLKWKWDYSIKNAGIFAVYLILFVYILSKIDIINDMFIQIIPVGYLVLFILSCFILKHLYRLYKFDKFWIKKTKNISNIILQICIYLIIISVVLSIGGQAENINKLLNIDMEYKSCNVSILSNQKEISEVNDKIEYKVYVNNNGNKDLENLSVKVFAENNKEFDYTLKSLKINETLCVYTGNYIVTKDDILKNGNGDNLIDITAKVTNDNWKHGSLSIPLKNKFTSYNPSDYNTYIVGADDEPIILYNNENAKDVSSQEVIRFIKSDNTDKQTYRDDFQCGDFAEMLHNNAELKGIRCGWVSVNGINHACNVFDTTDKGLIFIDCVESDTIVDVKENKMYKPRSITSSNVIYDPMGMITSYEIYW